MIKCDKCEHLLTVLKIHRNKAFCGNCKAWIAWTQAA